MLSALLGNDRIHELLSGSLNRGRLSHFYLISGPRGSGKHTLATILAAGAQCTGSSRPCGVCPACRKVLAGIHPDVITVDDPEKKTVSVDLVRQARQDVYVRPNEGNYKVYIFPRGQDMGLPAQNALLKVLEEPPGFGIFLLLTDNPDKMLATVRSRCTELKLTALPGDILLPALRRQFPKADEEALQAACALSGGFLGQARELLAGKGVDTPQTQDFARSFAGRDALGMLRVLTSMEKWKRETFIPQLDRWEALLTQALVGKNGGACPEEAAILIRDSRTAPEIVTALDAVKKGSAYASGNVSVGAVCGYLSWALQ